MTKTSLSRGGSMRHAHQWCAVVFLIAGLAACATTQAPTGAPTPVTPAAATTAPPLALPIAAADSQPEYRLRVGDQIDVKFFYNPELNESLVIRPDGAISLLLVGQITAAGLTPRGLESTLRQAYHGHLRQPEATVIVRKVVPQRVFVGGEVNQPTVVVFEGSLSVLQAVFHVGGFKFNAEPGNVLVFRTDEVTRKTEVIVVDLAQQLSPQPAWVACAGSANPQGCDPTMPMDYVKVGDLPLSPNDVVYVPQTRIGYLAQYIDENISRILPIYRNLGFSFFYNVRDDATKVITQP